MTILWDDSQLWDGSQLWDESASPPPAWWPTVIVEIAFGYGPWVDPPGDGWIEISDRVSSFNTTRGRTDEITDVQPGTASVSIDNTDRAFDPDNSGSPYLGMLLPNTQIRIRATWASVTYPVFRGYIDEFGPLDYNTDLEAAEIAPTAKDALAFMADRSFLAAFPWTIEDPVLGQIDSYSVVTGDPAWPAELSGARINRVLDFIGWPVALRDIDPGLTQVQADSFAAETTKVGPYLTRVAHTETGLLYVSAAGLITFRQRRSTAAAAQITAQATFSDNQASIDGYGALGYTDLQMSPPSVSRVRNIVTRGNGTSTATRADPDSIATFGPIEDTQTDLLTADPGELIDQAADFLGLHKGAVDRITQLQIAPEHDTTDLWPQVLGRELFDRIVIERTDQPDDPSTVRDVRIEQIIHTVNANPLRSWRTAWANAPTDARRYWTIEDPVLGVIDDPSIVIPY